MLLVVLVVAVAFLGGTTAAATDKVIGHAVRLKGTRIYYAHGTAIAPSSVYASVDPIPAQPVKVQWSLVCQMPDKVDPAVDIGASERGGQAVVHGSSTVKLALPYAKPATCVATVYATLSGNGGLMLRLLEA